MYLCLSVETSNDTTNEPNTRVQAPYDMQYMAVEMELSRILIREVSDAQIIELREIEGDRTFHHVNRQ